MSMATRGVFDLSVFNKSEQRATQLPGASVPGPWIYDLTRDGLQGALTMSNKVPVIVAFHSPRSENSAKLVATFERLVGAQAGRVQLAKVNVDEQAEVAQVFGISAVPAAAALLQAQPVPLFQGMPQDEQLAETVTKLIAAAEQYGITGVLDNDADAAAPTPEIPPLHREGREALDNGDLAGAHAAYAKALAENPGDAEAKTALHQVELLQRVAELKDAGQVESVLMTATQTPVTDVTAHLKAADIEFSFQRPDAAFARLIEVVRATSGTDRDAARERLLAFFDILGPSDLVTHTRKLLTNALF
ncbi:tetratricopeptide repeat protein [Trueperella pyogenes]|uniref:tetratricopeptide repeat protein n=1 Tax=Trueperella pyogenes TaxID=1661 RepID=UPI00312B7534